MARDEGIIQFIKHRWEFLTYNLLVNILEKRRLSAWEEFSRRVLETAALE